MEWNLESVVKYVTRQVLDGVNTYLLTMAKEAPNAEAKAFIEECAEGVRTAELHQAIECPSFGQCRG